MQPMENNPQPSKSSPLMAIVAVIVVVVVVAAGYLLWRSHHKAETKSTSSGGSTAVVQITKDGFVPATLGIKVGTTVQWNNDDTKPHQVGSNPYPTHADLPGLNSKTILPGANYTYKFTKAGNFSYYDGTVVTSHGTIEVK